MLLYKTSEIFPITVPFYRFYVTTHIFHLRLKNKFFSTKIYKCLVLTIGLSIRYVKFNIFQLGLIVLK